MDRQFTQDEAREIFARAAERQHAVAAEGEGLSLDELRAIGAEAGLSPEYVEAAARSVALGDPETGRLGFDPVPRGVSRTVVLPGPPTDALWEHVVADARRTFSAQGKLSGAGRIREWRNSNLRVSLEPTGDGLSRLHLQTRRDGQTQGAAILAVVAVFALVSLVTLSLDAFVNGGSELVKMAMVTLAAGVGSVGLGLGQRRWAATRERQFDEVARRAAEVAGAPEAAGAETVRQPEETGARIDPGLLADAPVEVAPEGRRRARTR